MAANLDPKTQALKLVVIVLGVLILLCLAIVLVTIYNRLSGMAGAPESVGPLSVDLPAGCGISGVTEGDGRLYLVIVANDPAANCPLVVILDTESGETVGRIDR